MRLRCVFKRCLFVFHFSFLSALLPLSSLTYLPLLAFSHLPSFLAQGAPRLLDLNGRYLAVATSTSLIKRYDVSRRSLKLLGSVRFGAKSLLNLDGDDGGSGGGANGQAGAEETVAEKAAARRSEALDLFFQQIAGLPASQMSGFSDEHKQRLGHIKMTSIKISADGARVSLLAELPDGAPDPRLHIWQADEGLHDRAFACHHFGEMSTPRYPIAHHWDAREHRLLVVESAIMRVHGDRSAGVVAASAAAAVAAAASKEGDEASKLGEGSAASATTAHSEAELAALERLVTTLFVASADELRRSAGLEGKSEEESNLAHLHNADSPRARRQRGEAARSRGHTVAEEDMDDAAREGEVEPTTGVMVQDVFALPDGMDAVSGMHVPHIYFVARKGYLRDDDDDDEIDDRRRGRTDDRSADRRMSRELMRDFVGLERVDNKTRRALLDFSYNLTLGLVDEGAFFFLLSSLALLFFLSRSLYLAPSYTHTSSSLPLLSLQPSTLFASSSLSACGARWRSCASKQNVSTLQACALGRWDTPRVPRQSARSKSTLMKMTLRLVSLWSRRSLASSMKRVICTSRASATIA